MVEKTKDAAVCDAGGRRLGLAEAGELLDESLAQEKKADKTLNEIALSRVNRTAA